MAPITARSTGRPAKLVGLQFMPFSSHEMIKRSVYEVKESNQLRNANLGLPNFQNRCLTCGAARLSDDHSVCPGHSAYIALPARVYHPMRMRTLVKLLNESWTICFYCCKRVDPQNPNGNPATRNTTQEAEANGDAPKENDGNMDVDMEERDVEMPDVHIVIPDSEDEEEAAPPAATTEKEPLVIPDSGSEHEDNVYTVIPDSEDEGATENHKRGAQANGTNAKSKASMANGKAGGSGEQKRPESEFCICNSDMPKLEFKLRTPKIGSTKTGKIVAMFKLNDLSPEVLLDIQSRMFDDWSHFNETRWKNKLLKPDKAYEYLRAIKLCEVRNTKAWEPEDYFIRTLYVSPNAIRVVNSFDGGLNFSDTRSAALRSLLKKIKSMVSARDGRSLHEVSDKDVLELQAYVAHCLQQNLLQCGYSPDPNKVVSGLTTLRKTLAKKTSDASARGVIRGDPYIGIDEIGVPRQVALQIGVPEAVTSMNIERLQNYIDKRHHGGVIRVLHESGEVMELRKDKKLQLGQTVFRHLQNGDEVFINRPPTFHKHALISLKARIYEKNVFSLNPLLCTPLFADFDGDAIHMFVAQSNEVRAELRELMSLPRQLVSSQGGNCIVGLIQDSLLASYLLTNGDVFLGKIEMDQVMVWGREAEFHRVPIPAIVKSAKGPLWTGKQVFGVTLPKGFEFRDRRFVISDGEVLELDRSWPSRLGRGKDSIMCAISSDFGPEKALEHLNSIQKITNHWISSRGFSVGLSDFYLVSDLASRRKLEEEIMCAVEEAKVAALVKATLADANVQMNSVANTRRSIWTGRPSSGPSDPEKSAQLEQVAISGFESVMRDLENVVKRHVSKGNSLLEMMESNSKGSLSRLVKQGACLGLQLREGSFHYDHFKGDYPRAAVHEGQGHLTSAELWKRKGLVANSFLDGLEPHEFFSHATASRASSTMMQKCASLFRFLMCYLKDLRVEYDNTVRWTYDGNHICQFDAGEASEPGEPIGTLAATAIIEPVYDMVMSSSAQASPSEEHPLTTLKNVLDAGVDRKCILRLSKHATKGDQGPEWVALKVQDQLKRITMRMITTKISIEYDGDISAQLPWVGVFELHQEIVWRCSIDVNEIVLHLNNEIRQFFFYTRNGKAEVPDICFCVTNTVMKAHEFHDMMIDEIFPGLLDTPVKGSKPMQSVTIKWDDPSKELTVECLVNHKEGFDAVKADCLPIADLLDWEKTAPNGLKEIYQAFGVEAAHQAIVDKLKVLTKIFGSRNISDRHLRVIADAACHSGKVLSFKSTDYCEFLKSMSGSSPLALALGMDPKKVFDEAATERSLDLLKGVTELAFCGKRPTIGTGANFEVLFNDP